MKQNTTNTNEIKKLEIMVIPKQIYLNTNTRYLNDLYRNGWTIEQEEDIIIFMR